ncbi:hypothetical protein [Methanobrevibacter sp. TMH8]|nr:hypothetical protein [Methanobrevibacter sp. TMH8]
MPNLSLLSFLAFFNLFNSFSSLGAFLITVIAPSGHFDAQSVQT